MLKKIAPCFFAIIIDALGFGLVYPVMAVIFTTGHSPVLPPYASASLHHFYLGISYMLYPLFMFFGASFAGDLSDIWGRKKVLLLCMGGISLSFGLMAWGVVVGSLSLLLIGRALSGLMAGSQPIAQASIADLSTPQTKAYNMSLISLSYSFGVVSGPLMGGVLSDRVVFHWFTLATPFIFAMLLAFGAFLWLFFLKETISKKSHKTISLMRPVHIFIEAFEHKEVRLLSIVFLCMQIGFSIYFQFVIIQMKSVFSYSNWELGCFQGMLGLGFAIGILMGMPFALKYMQVGRIAVISLALTGMGQVIASTNEIETLQWILAPFIAMVDMMAFASLLTLFSNAVDEKSQGWVMGISGSVMAVSWVVTGFGSNLFSLMTPNSLIGIGGGFLVVASWLLWTQATQLPESTS